MRFLVVNAQDETWAKLSITCALRESKNNNTLCAFDAADSQNDFDSEIEWTYLQLNQKLKNEADGVVKIHTGKNDNTTQSNVNKAQGITMNEHQN